MFSITLKRSAATLGVVAGLLAAAVPASAQGGGADFTRLEDRPQRGAITMLDYSLKASPQAMWTDVIWQGYANPADSNEVAVEGITLAHEGWSRYGVDRAIGTIEELLELKAPTNAGTQVGAPNREPAHLRVDIAEELGADAF